MDDMRVNRRLWLKLISFSMIVLLLGALWLVVIHHHPDLRDHSDCIVYNLIVSISTIIVLFILFPSLIAVKRLPVIADIELFYAQTITLHSFPRSPPASAF